MLKSLYTISKASSTGVLILAKRMLTVSSQRLKSYLVDIRVVLEMSMLLWLAVLAMILPHSFVNPLVVGEVK